MGLHIVCWEHSYSVVEFPFPPGGILPVHDSDDITFLHGQLQWALGLVVVGNNNLTLGI